MSANAWKVRPRMKLRGKQRHKARTLSYSIKNLWAIVNMKTWNEMEFVMVRCEDATHRIETRRVWDALGRERGQNTIIRPIWRD